MNANDPDSVGLVQGPVLSVTPPANEPLPERMSVELTNRCSKGCAFCYNHSTHLGATLWQPAELETFIRDCAGHGVQAVSFGGGEPLEYDGVFTLIANLKRVLFRSLTTNGLLLSPDIVDRLAAAAPDKVHISIHYPHLSREVLRVRDQVARLEARGIRSGVNLLVEPERVPESKAAVATLADAGIGLDRIVLLPLRGASDPERQTSPRDILEAAGGKRFQSMTCLRACQKSPRFCAVSWDRTAAWCSYTSARARIETLDASGLRRALAGLGLTFCGAASREEFA
jgi:sulfatase maturation enzyme AslB (radical SAM superfamily)